jgi:D-alanyl-lipoteichoic acid acyltransferase DltB (MBOAT superfamily)
MTFVSLEFLALLAVTLPLYFVLTRCYQNYLLLASSLIFYGWWDYRFLFLVLTTALVDYHTAQAVEKTSDELWRKRLLLLSVLYNLTVLGFFKYFNFFQDSFINLSRLSGVPVNPVLLNIVLPVGISFYTFQSMSYVVDVYRGHVRASRRFSDYLLYLMFFPQLVAGPIERYESITQQISSRRVVSWDDLSQGSFLIFWGVFKKVGVADGISPMLEVLYSRPSGFHGLALLLGMYMFAVQIYCDFSGYSDIARGVARLMGFRLMENFNFPYFATSITDFWRRWHISLSEWLRDYVYIPLGGNRIGKMNTYRNLLLTMLLGGLWHGASWCFVIWGGAHGLCLALHKLMVSRQQFRRSKPDSFFFRVISGVFTFHLVAFLWIPFRCSTLATAYEFANRIVLFRKGDFYFGFGELLRFFVLVTCLYSVEVIQCASRDSFVFKRYSWCWRGFLYATIITVLLIFGGIGVDVPFIYFQF